MEQKKKLKTANIVLAVLLVVSLLVLAAVLLLRSRPDAVSPDNHIDAAEPLSLTVTRAQLLTALRGSGDTAAVPLDNTIEFNGDSATMEARGMLPGDSAEKTFTVQVRHTGKVKLYFTALLKNDDPVTRPDGTQTTLSAGMNITVSRDGTTLYTGTLADLRNNVDSVALDIPGSGTKDVPYTVTVSLPTSAGNEFQEKTLTVDLKWWIKSEGGGGGTVIVVPPKTGDTFPLALTAGAAALSLCLLGLLIGKRRARHD